MKEGLFKELKSRRYYEKPSEEKSVGQIAKKSKRRS
ncbi:MAG: 30S ribosomal protein S21 [Bdellovibrionota bacterium]